MQVQSRAQPTPFANPPEPQASPWRSQGQRLLPTPCGSGAPHWQGLPPPVEEVRSDQSHDPMCSHFTEGPSAPGRLLEAMKVNLQQQGTSSVRRG